MTPSRRKLQWVVPPNTTGHQSPKCVTQLQSNPPILPPPAPIHHWPLYCCSFSSSGLYYIIYIRKCWELSALTVLYPEDRRANYKTNQTSSSNLDHNEIEYFRLVPWWFVINISMKQLLDTLVWFVLYNIYYYIYNVIPNTPLYGTPTFLIVHTKM